MEGEVLMGRAEPLPINKMLIGKAIEILTILSKGGNFIILNDNQDAVKLGLEGLKRSRLAVKLSPYLATSYY